MIKSSIIKPSKEKLERILAGKIVGIYQGYPVYKTTNNKFYCYISQSEGIIKLSVKDYKL